MHLLHRSYFAGNSVGEMARFDVRTGALLNQYKGFAGGLKSIQCCSDGTQSLVAATGLDRYLRVYSIQPPKLQHQVCIVCTACVGGQNYVCIQEQT